MENNQAIVKISNASVSYYLDQYRYSTFKEFLMQSFKGQRQRRLFRALDKVNIEVKRGESVALLGHNGSGKSTLLKVIAGIIEPQEAEIKIEGRIAPMIELGAGFDPELSGLENINLACTMMGLTEEEIASKLDSIIDFAELREFIQVPFKNYSSGMQARLGFACVTAVDPDILLIDEVLAVGDSNFAAKCLNRINQLRQYGTTIVMVSHDMESVRQFCDRGVVLFHGKIVYDGGVVSAIEEHEEYMFKKHLESLPEAQREDEERKRRLKKVDSENIFNPNAELPICSVSYALLQGDVQVSKVDLSRPFNIRFSITISHADLLNGEVSFGIGLLASNGFRIGGCNNLQKGLNLNFNPIAEVQKIDVEVKFSKDLRFIAPQKLRLICGIHDQSLRRTVYIHELAMIEFENSNLKYNGDQDFLNLPALITGFDVVSDAKGEHV